MNRRSFYILAFKLRYFSVALWDTNSPTLLSFFCLTARRTSFSKQKVGVWVIQSCPALWCKKLYPARLLCPWGFSRQEYWEWVAIPFSRGSSWPRDQTQVFSITGRFFTIWAKREASILPIKKSNKEYWMVQGLRAVSETTEDIHPVVPNTCTLVATLLSARTWYSDWI